MRAMRPHAICTDRWWQYEKNKMSRLGIIILFILMNSSCEERNLLNLQTKNKKDVVMYNMMILEKTKEYKSEDFDASKVAKDLKYIAIRFCEKRRCLKLKTVVHFNEYKKEPLIIETGNFELKEIAYTSKEEFSKGLINYEVMHGIIYETDNEIKFKKGSLINGEIYSPSNEIERIDTEVLIQFKRKE